MITAGYSGTPLIKKLGIKNEMKLMFINEPDNYFELLQTNIKDQSCKKNETPDLIHLFVKDKREFESIMKKIKPFLFSNPNITIWVSWYKKNAGISTDVTEDVIRSFALQNDLVDIKVCAVSNVWSGLKLVVPLTKRGKTKNTSM
ncbi:MAG: DUF3052 domain-containing protein [Bacteroidota bacterium]|nr:DUF3052 domain-containing protein [Bacteroidota bacterium]